MKQIEDRILSVYYEYPSREFTVRDISKATKIPKTTVHRYLTYLKKQGLITRENTAADTLLFKTKKVNYHIERIVESGLIDLLVKELNPDFVILFGSVRKGESDKDSDIDIFVESSIKKYPEIKHIEKKLGHKIQLFIQSDIHDVNEHLYNNILNGIILYGVIKIK